MITIEPLGHDASSLDRYRQLFAAAFPRSSLFSIEYLHWLYNANPDGAAIGFNAWDDGRLVAHYACVPTQALVNKGSVRTMLSLNTATHPSHQGRGLFLRLAEATYEAAAARGIQAVYGVANAQSTPGFTRKLGFQLVSPLDARVGIGLLDIDWEHAERATTFRRDWNADSIGWRVSNPNNPVRTRNAGGSTHFFTRALPPLLDAFAQTPTLQAMMPTQSVAIGSPLRLYLGLLPKGSCSFQHYFSIPNTMRPSPLNFIYRSLSQVPTELDPSGMCVSFLDFDAF